MPLGDEIAVLDGLNDLPIQYSRSGVIDASSGANYSGGSSFAPGLPLLPSNSGLAELAQSTGSQMSIIDTKRFQMLINMLGAEITADGAWGNKSIAGLVRVIKTLGDKSDSEIRAILTRITPIERGRKLSVPTAYLHDLIETIFAAILKPKGVGLGDLPNAYSMQNVLDASAGANYSGGSSFAPGLPLLPSNAGLAELADADLVQRYSIAAGVLAPRKNVLDASQGANYSGGSSYAPGLPLLPSNAGLAGLYDGKSLDDIDKYWGSTMGVDSTHYARTGVIDASAGANYSGGSSYAPGLPLLPSNAGLAGLDSVSDSAFKKLLSGQPVMQKAFMRTAAEKPLAKAKTRLARLLKISQSPQAAGRRWKIAQELKAAGRDLYKKRLVRANIASTFRNLASG